MRRLALGAVGASAPSPHPEALAGLVFLPAPTACRHVGDSALDFLGAGRTPEASTVGLMMTGRWSSLIGSVSSRSPSCGDHIEHGALDSAQVGEHELPGVVVRRMRSMRMKTAA